MKSLMILILAAGPAAAAGLEDAFLSARVQAVAFKTRCDHPLKVPTSERGRAVLDAPALRAKLAAKDAEIERLTRELALWKDTAEKPGLAASRGSRVLRSIARDRARSAESGIARERKAREELAADLAALDALRSEGDLSEDKLVWGADYKVVCLGRLYQ